MKKYMKKCMAILFVLLLLSSTYFLLIAEKTTEDLAENNGDYVVLLHGISRSSKQMNKLGLYLQKEGYEVINIDYPSTDYSLEVLTDSIHADLSKKMVENKPVHFVGYSMGGLLTRTIIHKYNPTNLGRVVQLATPNHGSEVSDFFKNNYVYKKILGSAGQQLITDQQKIEHLFGKIYYDLGIIAGNSTVAPISSIVIIPGEDDGRVSIESTRLEGMKDHIIIPASHTFLPSKEIVHQQVVHFLKNGVFKKTEG